MTVKIKIEGSWVLSSEPQWWVMRFRSEKGVTFAGGISSIFKTKEGYIAEEFEL